MATEIQRPMSLVKQADGRYGLQPALPFGAETGYSFAGGSPVASIAQKLNQLGRDQNEATSPRAFLPPASPVPGSLKIDQGRFPHPVPCSNSSPTGKSAQMASMLAHDQMMHQQQQQQQQSSVPRVARSNIVSKAATTAFAAQRPASPDEDPLRKKLLTLGSSFAMLDKQVEADARRRREHEDKRSHELREMLTKLEHELVNETRDREAEMLSLRQTIDHRIHEMVDSVQGRMSERFSKLSKTVESLTERLATMERGIKQFRGELPSKLQVDTAALKNMINELFSEFSIEQQRAADEAAALVHRIDEGEMAVNAQMKKELVQLERRGEALQELIDEFSSAQEDSEARSRKAALDAQFASLREALALEGQRREQQDDKVVQAINEYTSTLHRSLTHANA